MTMRNMMGLCLAALACLASPAGASDAQLWTNMSATVPLGDRFEAAVDGNVRFYDNAQDYSRLQLRAMLGMKLADGVLLGGGYSYVNVERAVGWQHEHRIFQQLNLPLAKIGKASLVGRTRLEQRWFENEGGTLWRLRQQVRLNIPLKGPEGLRAIVYTEPFFLLNQPNPGDDPTGLNEIRSFAGLGIPLSGPFALEAGYLNQTSFPGENEVNHVLNLGLTARF